MGRHAHALCQWGGTRFHSWAYSSGVILALRTIHGEPSRGARFREQVRDFGGLTVTASSLAIPARRPSRGGFFYIGIVPNPILRYMASGPRKIVDLSDVWEAPTSHVYDSAIPFLGRWLIRAGLGLSSSGSASFRRYQLGPGTSLPLDLSILQPLTL